MAKRFTEEQYREALEIWLSQNPGKTVNDVSRDIAVIISTREEIKLGQKIINLRQELKGKGTNKMSESQRDYWVGKHGLSAENRLEKTNQENELKYREALELWLSQNPGKTVNDVSVSEIVTLKNNKETTLGIKIQNLRKALKGKGTSKISESQREYWVEKYGLSAENQKEKLNQEDELKYREALELWLSENQRRTVNDVSQDTAVIISTGEEIKLGSRISTMRYALKGKGTSKISESQREYWVEKYGLSAENQREKTNQENELKYREALELWLSENPKKTVNDVLRHEIVTLSNGEEIKLGRKIARLRHALKGKGTSKSQRDYWVEKHGLSLEDQKKKTIQEDELKYREALELWLSQNPGKTVNDVPSTKTVILSTGEQIRLGKKIIKLRQALKGKGTSKISESQREYWVEKYGLSAENQREKTNQEKELKCREALELWLSQNPEKTVNDVSSTKTVILSTGEEINLGMKIDRLCQALKGKGTSKISESQRDYWVEKHGLSSENQKKKLSQENELKYREALELWLSKNPGKTVNDVLKSTVVIIPTGEEINLGRKIINLRHALKGKGTSESQRDYWVGKHGLRESKYDTSKRKETTLKKYTEMFDGDKEKAQRVIQTLKNIREKRKSKKKDEWNIDNVLQEFDVDIEKLMNCLNRTKAKGTKKSKTLEYQGKTLKEFCIENSFNYDVISRAIRLHEVGIQGNLEELINRELITYQKRGQKEPATWIYEKYGNLVKHILLYLNLDSSSILKEMTNYQITLEEAIRHEVFKKTKERGENSWLEELYEYLIDEVQEDKSQEQTTDDVANKFVNLVKEYHLTKGEINILWNSFSKYIETIKHYQLVDVGLETNEERKLEKIKDYRLEPEDIEESFFIPLAFDKNVLLGRKSELYQRRQLLRQYIIDWDYYTELEKQQIIIKHQFTEEEVRLIEKMRTTISETIESLEDSKRL